MVDDDCLKHLKNFASLNYLNAASTRISECGLTRLEDEMPNTTIESRQKSSEKDFDNDEEIDIDE
jgi:hypothetical protein